MRIRLIRQSDSVQQQNMNFQSNVTFEMIEGEKSSVYAYASTIIQYTFEVFIVLNKNDKNILATPSTPNTVKFRTHCKTSNQMNEVAQFVLLYLPLSFSSYFIVLYSNVGAINNH